MKASVKTIIAMMGIMLASGAGFAGGFDLQSVTAADVKASADINTAILPEQAALQISVSETAEKSGRAECLAGNIPWKKKNIGGAAVTVDDSARLMWITDPAAVTPGMPPKWEEAAAVCDNLTYAGYSDWRLPTIEELRSIRNHDLCHPLAINSEYFHLSNPYLYFWSSTNMFLRPSYAKVISFFDGGESNFQKTENGQVRCVRGI